MRKEMRELHEILKHELYNQDEETLLLLASALEDYADAMRHRIDEIQQGSWDNTMDGPRVKKFDSFAAGLDIIAKL